MPLKLIKYCLLLFVAVLHYLPINAQLQSAIIGKPVNAIINISFGAASNDSILIGPSLPSDKTSFLYSNNLCPPEGHYTIARRTNISGCFNNTWQPVTSDHTYTDNNGYMMLVNDTTTPYNKILFSDTVKQTTCNNTMYEFSAAIMNIDLSNYCSNGTARWPGFVFRVETTAGQVLNSYYTGRIHYGGSFLPSAYGSTVYGFDFSMPPGINSYVVKIIDSATGYGNCGYAFAVDDIKLLSLGPSVNINFPGLSGSYIQTSVCFQNDKSITINGNIDSSGYHNVALQWEQSIDSGLTWTDITGATNYNYTTPGLSMPDTFFFRLRAAPVSNIGYPYCGSTSNTIKVLVDGIPANFSVSNNSPVCTDSNLVFNLQGGTSYITTGPNGFFDDSPFPHIYYPTFADSGTYYVQVVTQGGCKATDSTIVKISAGPNIQMSPDTSICYGRSVQLQSGGGKAYEWSPPDGLSNAAIANPIASPVKTTTYTVKVSDETGCPGRGTVTIKLLDSALKAMITGPAIACPRDIIILKDTSTGSVIGWYWDFGNGQTSSLQNPPQQNFPALGKETPYTIKLIVTDTAACTDTAYSVIKSVNNCYIDVPGAFTPNGDGLNDYLYPLNAYKATNLLFRVFNRNGQLIFETKDWTKKWDGNYNGSPQAPGTYVWILNYTDADNKRVFLKGTTVLIR